MYLIISDVSGNATSSRVSKVFHDGFDVTGLRGAGEEKVCRRGSSREGPPEKVRRIRRRRSAREDQQENVCQRKSARECLPEKFRGRGSAIEDWPEKEGPSDKEGPTEKRDVEKFSVKVAPTR